MVIHFEIKKKFLELETINEIKYLSTINAKFFILKKNWVSKKSNAHESLAHGF